MRDGRSRGGGRASARGGAARGAAIGLAAPLLLAAVAVAVAACGEGDAGVTDAAAGAADAGADAADGDGETHGADGGAGDAETGTWREERPLPAPLQEVAVVALGERLLVLGGFDGRLQVQDGVRVLDTRTGEVSDGPRLPSRRHHVQAAALDGDVYVVGGMEGLSFTPLDTCYVLRAGATAWTPIAPLPVARGAGALVAAAGRLVLVGGVEPGGVTDTTWLYDPARDAWERGPPLPTAREHLCAVGDGDEVWVIAGRRLSMSSNRTDVEVLNARTLAFRTSAPLAIPHGGLACAVLGREAFVIGGETDAIALREVERVDLDTGEVRRGPDLPAGRHGHGAASAGGRVWVVGGGDRPAFAAVAGVWSFGPP